MRIRRIIAATIDIVILLFAFSLMLSIIPLNKETRDGYARIEEIEKKENITSADLEEINEISYEIDHYFVKYYLIFSLILIGYFIFIPKYRKDQTIGQKIMKVRLISENPITFNTYIIRALLNSGLTLLLFLPLLLYILNIVWYSNVASILILIQFAYWIISFIMILIKKEAIHDKITKTKIIEVKR
jgi:uncharacterized RDD family membrane protein YckC